MLMTGMDHHRVGLGNMHERTAPNQQGRQGYEGVLTLDVPPGDPNAIGYAQDFAGDDFYLDSHWAWSHGSELTLVTGLDVLGGEGNARSELFEYHVQPDGSGGFLSVNGRPMPLMFSGGRSW